jgi:predicted ABC-type ATPase
MLKRIDSFIDQRHSFAFETTGAGRVHLRTLSRCREAGYHVGLIFVHLASAELAIDRVKARVRQGGHSVRDADIERRYRKSLSLLKEYMALADEVKLLDNTHGSLSLIAEMRRAKNWMVHQPRLWSLIQEQMYG